MFASSQKTFSYNYSFTQKHTPFFLDWDSKEKQFKEMSNSVNSSVVQIFVDVLVQSTNTLFVNWINASKHCQRHYRSTRWLLQPVVWFGRFRLVTKIWLVWFGRFGSIYIFCIFLIFCIFCIFRSLHSIFNKFVSECDTLRLWSDLLR